MDAEPESTPIQPVPHETPSEPTPTETPGPIDGPQRRHDLLLQAFRLDIKLTPEESDTIPLDELQALVAERRGKRDQGLAILQKGAPEDSPVVKRHDLLMKAHELGVPFTIEESETITAPELEQRIAAHLAGKKK